MIICKKRDIYNCSGNAKQLFQVVFCISSSRVTPKNPFPPFTCCPFFFYLSIDSGLTDVTWWSFCTLSNCRVHWSSQTRSSSVAWMALQIWAGPLYMDYWHDICLFSPKCNSKELCIFVVCPTFLPLPWYWSLQYLVLLGWEVDGETGGVWTKAETDN